MAATQHNNSSSNAAAPDLCPLHGDEAALLLRYLPEEALIPADHARSSHAAAAAAAMRSSSAVQGFLKLLCQMRSGVTDGLLLLHQRSTLGLLTQPHMVKWRTATITALTAWLSTHAPDRVPAGKGTQAVHDAVARVLTDQDRLSAMLDEVRRLWVCHLEHAASSSSGSRALPAMPPPIGGSNSLPAMQPPIGGSGSLPVSQPPTSSSIAMPAMPPPVSGLLSLPLSGGVDGLPSLLPFGSSDGPPPLPPFGSTASFPPVPPPDTSSSLPAMPPHHTGGGGMSLPAWLADGNLFREVMNQH